MMSSGHTHLDRQRYDMACHVTPERVSDVVDNLGQVSCTERTVQGNDFELIPAVKIETRHPAEGSFGNNFSATCNHCVVMAA